MTDASNTPLQILEDADAAPSDVDVTVSDHHDHAIMNRRLDEDAV